MIIRKLKLKNFKQYSTLDLDIPSGLIGITGKNGAGKSSIFEAFLIALFGTSGKAKGFYKSAWAEEKDPVEIVLEFEVDQQGYEVHRYFQGKNETAVARLFEEGDKLMAEQPKAVNQAIGKLIQMDYNSFKKSVFANQKELGELTSATQEERRRLIRRMLGFDQLDDALNEIRNDIKNYTSQIKGKSNLLLDESQIKSLKKDIDDEKEKLKSKRSLQDQLNKELSTNQTALKERKESYKKEEIKFKEFHSLNTKLERYQSAVDNFKSNIKAKEKKLSELAGFQKEIESKSQLLEQYEIKSKHLQLLQVNKEKHTRKIDLKKRLEELRKELETLAEKEKSYVNSKDRKVQLIKTKEAKETLSNSLRNEKRGVELKSKAVLEKIHKINSRITERKEQMDQMIKLGEESECPVCLRPLIDTYQSTLQKLENEIQQFEKQKQKEFQNELEQHNSKVKDLEKRLEQLDEELKSVDRELAVTEQQLKLLEEVKNDQKKLKHSLSHIQKELDALSKLHYDDQEHRITHKFVEDNKTVVESLHNKRTKVEEIPKLREEITSEQKRVADGEKHIEATTTAVKNLSFHEEKFDALRKEVENLESARELLLNKSQDLAQKIQKLELAIQDKRKTLDQQKEIKARIQETESETQTLEKLKSIFSDFRTHVLEIVQPTVSEYASYWFEKMTQGKYEQIKVNDAFEFEIWDDGEFYPIQRFSGGEIDLANLCLRLAISQLIFEASGKDQSVQFLAFDEIFGSQDENRRHEILKGLELLQESYSQIMIISHVEAVKDHFQHILEVKTSNSGSTARWI